MTGGGPAESPVEGPGFNQPNATVVLPNEDYSSNATTPSDGLTEFVEFLGNNIWVSLQFVRQN